MNVECPIGSVIDSERALFGVISNEFSSFTWCNQWVMDPLINKNGHQNCTGAISVSSRQTFTKELKRKCKGKLKCSLSFQNLVDGHRPEVRKACDDESYLFL